VAILDFINAAAIYLNFLSKYRKVFNFCSVGFSVSKNPPKGRMKILPDEIIGSIDDMAG